MFSTNVTLGSFIPIMLCLLKLPNTVHTSCYWVLKLLCVKGEDDKFREDYRKFSGKLNNWYPHSNQKRSIQTAVAPVSLLLNLKSSSLMFNPLAAILASMIRLRCERKSVYILCQNNPAFQIWQKNWFKPREGVIIDHDVSVIFPLGIFY